MVIDEGAYARGRLLGELGLETLGVEVNAIRRHGIRGMRPLKETRVAPGDVLVLLGTPESLAQAEIRLMKG